MNKISKLAIAVLVVVGMIFSAVSAFAGPVTATGKANATVVKPIAMTHAEGDALNFGDFSVMAAGTVIINPTTGFRTVTGGVTKLGGTVTADKFTVTGAPGQSFSITDANGSPFTDTVTLVKAESAPGAGDGSSMTASLTTSISTGTISNDAAMQAMFTVGGSLSVALNQMPGTYMGTYDIIAQY